MSGSNIQRSALQKFVILNLANLASPVGESLGHSLGHGQPPKQDSRQSQGNPRPATALKDVTNVYVNVNSTVVRAPYPPLSKAAQSCASSLGKNLEQPSTPQCPKPREIDAPCPPLPKAAQSCILSLVKNFEQPSPLQPCPKPKAAQSCVSSLGKNLEQPSTPQCPKPREIDAPCPPLPKAAQSCILSLVKNFEQPSPLQPCPKPRRINDSNLIPLRAAKSLSLQKIQNTQKSLCLTKSRETSKSISGQEIHSLPTTEIVNSNNGLPNATPQQSSLECPDADQLKVMLKAILPDNYDHHIVSVEPMYPYHKNQHFDQRGMLTCVLRLSLKTKEEALLWLKKFQASSFTDWRIRRNFKEETTRLIFKQSYRCHHNTLAQYRDTKKGHAKHTECEASLILTVKNSNMKRSKDELLKKYPTEITVNHCHNHPLEAADSLRHRRPSSEVEEKFRKLFQDGYSPSTALHTHQYDIQINHGDDFFKILADGSQCPNQQWCYNLYRQIFKSEYGAPTGEEMVIFLRSAVDKYNEQCGSTCASVQVIDDSDIIIAMCTPLMKRVHRLKSSGELGFVDSGGMMDRQNHRVFPLLTPSVAGALPLGLVVTSSESEKVIEEGFNMLLKLVPENAFGGRGAKGPQIFITDDSSAERNALRNVFPDSVLLLCLFHVLQAYWRYIWDSKHKVDPGDKIELYHLFRDVCRSDSEDDFRMKYEAMQNHPKVLGNKSLSKHLSDLYDRAPEWALSFRTDLLTRGNNTNNYSEANVRRMKEDVLDRLMAYSLVQLFDFFTTRLGAYYERRIAGVLNNRVVNYFKSKHFIPPAKLLPLKCFVTSQQRYYLVKNIERKTEYTVDMELELSTCPVGSNGAPCKHQLAVVKEFNLPSAQFLPADEQSKLALHNIMSDTPAPIGWYVPLKAGPFAGTETTQTGEISETQQSQEYDDSMNLEDSEYLNERTYDQDKIDSALEKWEAINSIIVNGLKNRPDTFVEAVEKFSKRFQRAQESSENCLLSAMHTFNDHNSVSRSAVRKNILVNKTSVTRRQQKLGGRKMTRQGRIPKTAFTSEHGYSQAVTTNKEPCWNKLPSKRRAVPHILEKKVSESGPGPSKKRK